MKCFGFAALLIGLGLFGVRTDAHAGTLADVRIIDRDTGSILPVYRSRGEYWVAGRPGSRYSILIQNHRNERLLAVTAVDGVNVLSGETGAWGQSGYVFAPGESYEITGWRKSNSEIAAFNFTAAGNSYAARTGRPADVGIIGVALFLERPARVPPYQSFVPRSEESPPATSRIEGGLNDLARAAAPPLVAAMPPAPKATGIQPYASPSESAPAQKLGTGHGARETSYVQDTSFDRLSSTPNEVIKIRYDSYENLVAMGVVPARPEWRRPNPFPDSPLQRYVPDPPGG